MLTRIDLVDGGETRAIVVSDPVAGQLELRDCHNKWRAYMAHEEALALAEAIVAAVAAERELYAD